MNPGSSNRNTRWHSVDRTAIPDTSAKEAKSSAVFLSRKHPHRRQPGAVRIVITSYSIHYTKLYEKISVTHWISSTTIKLPVTMKRKCRNYCRIAVLFGTSSKYGLPSRMHNALLRCKRNGVVFQSISGVLQEGKPFGTTTNLSGESLPAAPSRIP